MRIVLADTTASGTETARLLLDDVPSPVRLRDLICHRVREEVARDNAHSVDWRAQVRWPAAEMGQIEPDWTEHEARAGHLADVPRRHDWVRSGDDGGVLQTWDRERPQGTG